MERFLCKTQIISGAGSLQILHTLQIRRLLIVADPFFCKNGTVNHIAHLANAQKVSVFSEIAPDPTVLLVAKGVRAALDFAPDTMIALGGGSAMDCAKAIAYFSGAAIRLIAVPTTSGSGSEVTDFSILTHDGIKHPLVDEKLRPDMAILDSDLLHTLPPGLIAETGFDLISHALEAWVATNAGAISAALAFDALRTGFSRLLPSRNGDLAARQAIHSAATMAGIAFSSAGLGLCHAISHALGGAFHVPHGRLNAILLPAVIDCNASIATARYAQLARRLQLSAGADSMALRALKNTLCRLRRELALPEDLAAAGIAPAALQAQLPALTDTALADPCCSTNPVPPQPQHIRQILLSVTGNG